MLLPREDIVLAYEQILVDARRGGCTVLVLVAPDADAMCSCRILTYLLRTDHISYKIKAVHNYTDVSSSKGEIAQGDIRTVVMINCGAILNVGELLDLSVDDEDAIRCFVLDAHRPLHLSNIDERNRAVVVLDDGHNADEVYPTDVEGFDFYAETSDEDDELESDEESEGEQENEFDVDEAEGDETITSNAAEGNDDGDVTVDVDVGVGGDDEPLNETSEEDRSENEADVEDNDFDDGEGDPTAAGNGPEDHDRKEDVEMSDVEAGDTLVDPESVDVGIVDSEDEGQRDAHTVQTGRRRQREEAIDAQVERKKRAKVRDYYSRSYFGFPSAVVLFDLCFQKHRAHEDQLWLACLSLTDYYVHQKITHELYESLHQYLKSHIDSWNASQTNEMTVADGTVVPTAENGKVYGDSEMRFMLYRHWSLYDSMYYSPYVASRLAVWKANGKDKLHELLAKMGVALEQCRQKWTFMVPSLRSRVQDMFEEYGDQYGLDDIYYPAFQRCTGFNARTSAADVIHAVTALLEARPPKRVVAADADANEDDADEWQAAFWRAYEALPGKDSKEMEKGLELSMRLQKAVVHQAIALVEKRRFTCLRHFRYSYLPQSHASSSSVGMMSTGDIFGHPMALAKLALFIVDVHRQNGKWSGHKARPLIILAERASTYLVVGVPCPEIAGNSRQNFGRAFHLAATKCNARVRHNGFESSVMEISREHAHRFIENLHYSF